MVLITTCSAVRRDRQPVEMIAFVGSRRGGGIVRNESVNIVVVGMPLPTVGVVSNMISEGSASRVPFSREVDFGLFGQRASAARSVGMRNLVRMVLHIGLDGGVLVTLVAVDVMGPSVDIWGIPRRRFIGWLCWLEIPALTFGITGRWNAFLVVLGRLRWRFSASG